MVPKLVFQAADGEDLVILFAPLLTDPPVWQTDGQAELRRAKAIAAFARKNRWGVGSCNFPTDSCTFPTKENAWLPTP